MDLCVIGILKFLLNKVEPKLADLRGEITEESISEYYHSTKYVSIFNKGTMMTLN